MNIIELTKEISETREKEMEKIEFPPKRDYEKLGDETELVFSDETIVEEYNYIDVKKRDEAGNPTEKKRYLVFTKGKDLPLLVPNGVMKDVARIVKKKEEEGVKATKVRIISNGESGLNRRYIVKVQ